MAHAHHPRNSGSAPTCQTGEELVFWRDPALPMIEGRQARHTRRGYRAHTHPTWSFGVVDAGASGVKLGGQRWSVRAGDVVVIPPDCVHACNPRAGSGSWSYRMFYVDDAWLRAVGAGPGPVLSVLSAGPATALMNQVQRCLCGPAPAARRQNQLARCLRQLLRLAVRRRLDRPDAPEHAVLTRLKDHLRDHLLEKVPLTTLSAISGLSRYQIIRLFKKHLGLTPHAYQVDQRINRSRALLRQGHPLADVAYATGFADQSHFQRSFQPRVAVTPAGYCRTRAPAGAAPS